MIGKHWSFFGLKFYEEAVNELNQSFWNQLRCDDVPSPYAIEKSIEEYENNCNNHTMYKEVADLIVANAGNLNSIISFGVGKAILEYHLKKLNPSLTVDCTDYTVDTVELLKRVFVQRDDIFQFDMKNDSYQKLKNYDLGIFYRVSTEFSFDEWRRIFEHMSVATNIDRFVFIPTENATKEQIKKEEKRHNEIMQKQWHDTFCGWLYTRDEFFKMWDGLFWMEKEIPYNDTSIYFIKRI